MFYDTRSTTQSPHPAQAFVVRTCSETRHTITRPQVARRTKIVIRRWLNEDPEFAVLARRFQSRRQQQRYPSTLTSAKRERTNPWRVITSHSLWPTRNANTVKPFFDRARNFQFRKREPPSGGGEKQMMNLPTKIGLRPSPNIDVGFSVVS